MALPLGTQVEPKALLAHLQALEGERHPYFSPERLKAAQEYICSCWRSYGLALDSHEFPYMSERFVNLIARPHIKLHHCNAAAITTSPRDRNTRGKSSLDEQAGVEAGPRLIIGAHVDTVPGSPGADDNASGLAVLLEISRIVAKDAPCLAVEFVVFNLEELGMVGSYHYAAALSRSKTKLIGMISLEMVGFTESQGTQYYPWFLRNRFPKIGNYLGLAANNRSRILLKQLADAMRAVEDLPIETLVLPANGLVFPESRLSDHSPFWDKGYPAILATDTAFFRNPHYHKQTDTIDTLDLGFMTKVTKGLLAAIESIVGSP